MKECQGVRLVFFVLLFVKQIGRIMVSACIPKECKLNYTSFSTGLEKNFGRNCLNERERDLGDEFITNLSPKLVLNIYHDNKDQFQNSGFAPPI